MTTTLDSLQAQVDTLNAQMAALMEGVNPPADAVLNDDGSITLSVRMRFLNPFDINATGVGTITVLPSESLAAFLPLLGRGAPGLSPVFDVPTLHEVPDGTALPTPPFTITPVDPGDPLATPPAPPVWHIEVWLHAGPAGLPGTPVNLGALGDVFTPDGGLVPGFTLVYRTPAAGPAGWYVEPVRVTDFAVCTAFTPASGNAPNQVLGSLTLAAQGYQRRPWVDGACQVNPAADTTNGITHIDLIARLFTGGGTVTDPTTGGVIVGYGQGLDTNAPFIANLHPTQAAVGGSAIIPAGQAGVIYLIAQQTNPTLSNWATVMTHASFSALGLALV
jgi:hypothetical protein